MRTAAVDHDRRMILRACLRNCVRSIVDVFSRVVWTLRSTAQNDVHVLVSTCLDDRCYTLFGDTHECVGVAARTHRVDSDGHAAIGTILEADWERHARSEFPMELRFCSACADRTPRNEVIQILRRNSVQELCANRNSEIGEIAEKLAGKTESLVNLKRTIYGGVVDEAFPADCRAW